MNTATVRIKRQKLLDIQRFLVEHADSIQKRATQQHKIFLGGDRFRTEIIEKYQVNHIKVVRALARHLLTKDITRNSSVFGKLGETLAKDAVKDTLTIEEAIDGIIFLKQALWEKLEQHGFLRALSTQEFYVITQATGTFVDIVVSKIAFTYHQYYKERKEKQEKQKNEFIGLISHELKTPVTSVKAFAQVMEHRFEKSGDIQSAALLKKMDAQLNKLTGLIMDLLDVTKIETGKLQFHKKLFDFNELVSEIVEEMQRTTNKHKLIIKLGKTNTIYADRDRMGQVLINLLTNSIKYSPHTDKIIINTDSHTDQVELSIQDFGVGIPKDAQDKVFDQFYRVEGTNEQTFSGMGLGLYVCAEIIKRQKGQIWVESQLGKGSTFFFTLPIGHENHVEQGRKKAF